MILCGNVNISNVTNNNNKTMIHLLWVVANCKSFIVWLCIRSGGSPSLSVSPMEGVNITARGVEVNTTINGTTRRDISCQVIPCHVMWGHIVKSHYVMWCPVMSCDVMSCHAMSCHVMWCHVLSCDVLSFEQDESARRLPVHHLHRTPLDVLHHTMTDQLTNRSSSRTRLRLRSTRLRSRWRSRPRLGD